MPDVGAPAGSAASQRSTRLTRLPSSASEWVAAMGVGAIATAFVLSPDHIEDGPVLCPFRMLTGLPCPGCGLTRSFTYMAHGWWSHALASNPFGFVAVVAFVALAVGVVAARVRRGPPPDLERIFAKRWVRAVLLAWVAFGVVRIAVVAG